jgi:DNA-binding transcriptional LysR family regulator
MDLRIKQFKVFLALAETLHFGKAAQQLYMSQPALTFQIQSMESEIGMQLFNRDRRHVELTEAGKNLVITGNRIMSELRQFKENLGVLATEQQLRVICAPSGEHVILPTIIRRLKEIWPNCNVVLSSYPPIEYLRALQENHVDVLLMVRKVETPGVTFQPITKQQMYAVVPEHSVFAQRGSISVQEFAENPVIVTSRQFCDQTQPLYERMLLPYGVTPQFIEAPGQQSAQMSLVAAGVGLAMANEWRLQAPPFPGIKMVPFEQTMPPMQLGAAWRSSAESPMLNSFKLILEDVIYELSKEKKPSLALAGFKRPAVASMPLTEHFPAQAAKYLRAG